MEKISACLVVRNEEAVIGRCLENIRGAVDEIIVLHDGKCNDKTFEICKKYGAKVFVEHLAGFCDVHRSKAISLASNEWILVIDADELLSEELKDNLQKLVKRKGISAFTILFSHFHLNKKELKHVLGSDYHIRLFRKNRAHYSNRFWDIPEIDGKIEKVYFPMLHKPLYDNFTLERLLKKHFRIAKLQAINGKHSMPRLFYLPNAFVHFFRKIAYYWFVKLGFLDGIVGLKVGLTVAAYHFALNYYTFKYYCSGEKT